GDSIELAGVGPQCHSAWRVDAADQVGVFQATPAPESAVAAARALQRYLIDPHAAIRAAGLTAAFAAQHAMSFLDGAAGFLTSDHLSGDDAIAAGDDPAAGEDTWPATVGEVIWSGSADDRKLRRELRRLDVYPIRIKVRGDGPDPAVLLRRYRQLGSQPVTLWLGRCGNRRFAACTQIAGF
ncbi:MAG: hypothetical protein AAF958_17985, partial [Planctomycetota bacterium]